MRAQRSHDRAPLRMVGLLTVGLAVVALTGRWFNLPVAQGVPNWRLDFSAAELARQAAYRGELSIWRWWALFAPLVMVALIVLIRPLRMRLIGVVQAVPLIRQPGKAALLCALVLSASSMTAWPAEFMTLQVNRRWGLTSQSAGGLTLSLLRDAAVTAAAVFVFGSLFLRTMRRWRRTWSTRIAGGVAIFCCACGFIPAMQGFTPERTAPLPSGNLSQQISKLKAATGLASVSIRVSTSGSTDNGLNAYATGAGPWARVVLQRASVKQSRTDELVSMVAHELGHIRAKDPLLAGCASGCVLGILIAGMGWWQRRRGFSSDSHMHSSPIPVRVVPVLVLGWLSLQIAALPLLNSVSRGIETRADIAALQTTKDPQAFISMMRRVAVTNLGYIGNDSPYQWLRSHPPIVQRIANARAWAAENGIAVPPGMMQAKRASGLAQGQP